jgi:hypothetical protein
MQQGSAGSPPKEQAETPTISANDASGKISEILRTAIVNGSVAKKKEFENAVPPANRPSVVVMINRIKPKPKHPTYRSRGMRHAG